MRTHRQILLALMIFSTAAAQALPQSQAQLSDFKDSYPNRESLLQQATLLCGQLMSESTLTSSRAAEAAEKFLSKPTTVTKLTPDSSGWLLDLNLKNASTVEFLRLSKFKSSFTFNYRQKESDIEGIANISLEENCTRLQEARFTYFNSGLRPAKRVKVNSLSQITQVIPMEEPVMNQNLTAKSDENAIRIGIIDSGIDYNHPTLIGKSRPMLGVDLTNPNRAPFDYTNTVQNELMGRHFSHGSAVADIASRNVNVLIIPVRTENQIQLDGEAVAYLAQKKVRIINVSQGTADQQKWLPFKNEMLKHPEILFIVAAGNNSQNIDDEPDYPSSFEVPNMLVVASVGRDNQLSKFSNYGAKHVHLAALGENVSAALAGGGEWTVNGTSFAAPLVANIAAKLLSENPNLTALELRDLLIRKARPEESLKGRVRYGIL